MREVRLSLKAHMELWLSKEIMMFSIFGEPHNNFSEQVCVDDCHVATSDNTTLHLKIYIFFHTVAPRALSLCETQFSLEVGQGKCMSNP